MHTQRPLRFPLNCYPPRVALTNAHVGQYSHSHRLVSTHVPHNIHYVKRYVLDYIDIAYDLGSLNTSNHNI